MNLDCYANDCITNKKQFQTVGYTYELIVIDNSEYKYSIFEAYNLGIERSSGEYLCFIHDDILFHSQDWGKAVEGIFNDDVKIGLIGNFGNDEHIIKADIKKMGLEDIVEFVGEQANPVTFYNNFDVLLLTSREDPFPLVCIEVAHLEKPIICFNKASGTTEIIKKGGGFVVPYLDVSAMAEKIMWYYSNPDKVITDGEKAKELFSGFTAHKMIPLLYEQIKSLINEK